MLPLFYFIGILTHMLRVPDYFYELRLRRDAHVADFGCGVGTNTKILSEMIPQGKVFAIDVHKDLLEHIETDIIKEKRKEERSNLENREGHVVDEILYQNIVPVWGDIEELEGTRLRDESIDAILISNTFGLLTHRKTCIFEMRRVLKKYGKILFIDWHTPIGQAIHQKENLLKEVDIASMFTEAGFMVHPKIMQDDHHFVLLMEKR